MKTQTQTQTPAKRKPTRGDVLSADCPSRVVLNHVTNRWGGLVLLVLREGVHRFSELRRRIDGVSERMLAQTLQDLEADGFVKRQVHPVMPPHVDYELTPLGYEVSMHVYELIDCIEGNLPRILRNREAA
jgi:DNA-binding HxlR family transcriptional regulator